jgi:ABC-2 type transport system ATP-binding protein
MPTLTFDLLTKSYRDVVALSGVTAQVRPGRITAFLGANGSGKTTSLRILLGLSQPDSGSATIGGLAYRNLRHPTRTVGAVLDQGFHPNRTARNTLRIAAAQAAVPRTRVEDVLDLVGLTEAAGRRVAGFSLGMRQRLALAGALIGDPSVLVLDEPLNGLDPAGITTMRTFLRGFADQGGTVLLSSHLLSEVAHSADDALIIDHGRVVAAGPVDELAAPAAAVVVTSSDPAALTRALTCAGAHVAPGGPDELVVHGASRHSVGQAALAAGAVVTGMRSTGDDLEQVFASLIHSSTHSATHSSEVPA